MLAREVHAGSFQSRVVTYDAHVGEMERVDAVEEGADTGQMHVDRDKIDVAMRVRNHRGCFAHAESDLEHDRRSAAENARPVDDLRRERHAVAGKQVVARATLRGRQPPLPQHITANRPAWLFLRRIGQHRSSLWRIKEATGTKPGR